MTFSFSSLSLSGVQAAAAGSVLSPGKYVVKVREVEVAETKAKNGQILKVKLACDEGVITDNINVFNANSEAQRIGREQLKALLVCGGHPDPDNIGQHGVQSIRGLTVGIIVVEDGMYDGKPQVRVKGYLKPSDVGGKSTAPVAPATPIGSGTGMPF